MDNLVSVELSVKLSTAALTDSSVTMGGLVRVSDSLSVHVNLILSINLLLYLIPVTVQCIRDGQFVVVVARDVTLPRLSLDSVRLVGGNEPPCGPVDSTPFFAIYQFPVTACGTSMIVSSFFWFYSAWLMMDWMPTVFLFAGGQWICGV